MIMPRPTVIASLLLLTCAMFAGGCVQRTISITSQPSGALVHLNDQEVGRTPLTVPFTYYGTYDVRLERDGYVALWTEKKAEMPWWEVPGPDLVAEAVGGKSELFWHFDMVPQEQARTDELIDHARQMRALANEPAEGE